VDHLNTPRLVANQSGQTVWRWDQQEPFGVNVPDENPSSLGAFEFPLRFPGQYADKETNLYYNYFRDYDPITGRYDESDPIGLRGGINTYAYGRVDPLRHIDPQGLFNLTLSTGGSAFVAAMGASAASGFAFDFPNGNVCLYSIICARAGLGLQASLQFLQVGMGSGTLCTGQYKTNGIFASGGPISGSVRVSQTGIAASSPLVGGGPGFGYAGGIEACHVTLQCSNDPPCCRNPATCGTECPKPGPQLGDITAP
jgi:RHS repeat-associated protein